LLKAALTGCAPPYSHQELHELADHCTRQDDAARKVERQMRKSEAALLLQSRSGQRLDAPVTGVSDKGVWVRIMAPPAEGRLTGNFVQDL
jgi:exoribonuclease-2